LHRRSLLPSPGVSAGRPLGRLMERPKG
jgi:hypothetical protein